MKNKNQLDIRFQCTKEELLERIKVYKHRYEYIRVAKSNDYDVCLELTWQQHSNPFVEYYYLANIVDNQLIGKIVKPRKSKIKISNEKLPFLVIMQIFGLILLALLFLYGLPFFIVYGISGRLFLSFGLGGIPLITFIVYTIVFDSDHIPVHKANIIQAINELDN